MSATARYLSRASSAYKNRDGVLLSQILFIEQDPDVEIIANELLPVCLNPRRRESNNVIQYELAIVFFFS